MKFKSDNGVEFTNDKEDDPFLFIATLQDALKRDKLPLFAFMATFPDGKKSYVLIDPKKREVVYENTSFETVGSYIMMMGKVKNFDEPR